MAKVRTPGESGPDDLMDVDGEQVPRKAWQDFKRNEKWQATQEARAAELKREKEALDKRAATMSETEREVAALRADVAELRGGSRKTAEVPRVVDLGNPLDDPEKFASSTASELASLRAEMAELRKENRGLKTEMTEGVKMAETRATGKVARNQAVSANEQILDAYCKENDIVGDDKTRLRTQMDGLRIEQLGYGAFNREAGVFQFTTKAAEDADRLSRREYHEENIRTQGFNKGLGERGSNGKATAVILGEGGVPKQDASAGEMFDYYSALPENSRAAWDFAEKVGADVMGSIIEEGVNRQVSLMGSGAPM